MATKESRLDFGPCTALHFMSLSGIRLLQVPFS